MSFNVTAKILTTVAMLLDLHGNGDFRYLAIGDFHTGTYPGGHKCYIVDVKNNFKLITDIEGGETLDIPYTQNVLKLYKMILNLGYYYPIGEVLVEIPVRYIPGGEPEIGYRKIDLTKEKLDELIRSNRELKKSLENPDDAIAFLYAILLEHGCFKSAKEIALKAGYSREVIEKFYAEAIENIKSSHADRRAS